MLTEITESGDKYYVGDLVETADGDIGKIVALYPAVPKSEYLTEPCDCTRYVSGRTGKPLNKPACDPNSMTQEKWVWEHPQDGCGAVIDFGPEIGELSYSADYFHHHDGPVPENTDGFMEMLTREYDGNLDDFLVAKGITLPPAQKIMNYGIVPPLQEMIN